MRNKVLLVVGVIVIVVLCIYPLGICKVTIPTYSQNELGYPLGCEGISLYMALKGKGYVQDTDVDDFMAIMPQSDENPEYGFVGDPSRSKKDPVNADKRTTIYPAPLAKWGKEYGNVEDISGASTDELKEQLELGNPIIVYVTGGYKTPKWQEYSWGKAVTNGHVVCLVGYSKWTGDYLVNDCGSHLGEYWVNQEKFEKIYLERRYAVVVK